MQQKMRGGEATRLELLNEPQVSNVKECQVMSSRLGKGGQRYFLNPYGDFKMLCHDDAGRNDATIVDGTVFVLIFPTKKLSILHSGFLSRKNYCKSC